MSKLNLEPGLKRRENGKCTWTLTIFKRDIQLFSVVLYTYWFAAGQRVQSGCRKVIPRLDTSRKPSCFVSCALYIVFGGRRTSVLASGESIDPAGSGRARRTRVPNPTYTAKYNIYFNYQILCQFILKLCFSSRVSKFLVKLWVVLVVSFELRFPSPWQHSRYTLGIVWQLNGI